MANTDYSAPVAWVDYDIEIGAAIWPCPDCLPWHLEIASGPDGIAIIREWHAVECPLFVSVMATLNDDQ